MFLLDCAVLNRAPFALEIDGDNLNNVRRGASRHFRNKKREYLKDKVNKVASNSKNKNI
jgi:hypothetical protein